ncbi:hypothetical protein ACFQ4M_17320 [Thauera mechernichensis]|uniref:Arc-like DNA binding domain-containing protein n=1 Tax=Thauera mechernichensis TaxID=82788 RepID=A0ABW3WHM2_9RHOO|nr:hypothetical protein [Thauera mechernichensis]MDG3065998.1 hypothetical protein [Thauera mechernichensis]
MARKKTVLVAAKSVEHGTFAVRLPKGLIEELNQVKQIASDRGFEIPVTQLVSNLLLEIIAEARNELVTAGLDCDAGAKAPASPRVEQLQS